MNDSHVLETSAFEKLGDTPLTLAQPDQDIRGRTVRDPKGDEVGRVSALFVDRHERKVRMLEIEAGGFLGLGARHFVMPVESVTSISPDDVFVSASLALIVHSPVYDPQLVRSPMQEAWDSYYDYYGIVTNHESVASKQTKAP
jgi:sporulation protein YlmC with PRC-barrel domain